MTNYNVSDFVGILITIGLFAYLTNLLWWGLYQVIRYFFEDTGGESPENTLYHFHYYYKSK